MTYIPGDFWRVCEVCGFNYRASQTFKRWDNLIVCAADYEEQHPQDFVRGRTDSQNVPDPRPPGVDRFLGPLSTTLTADAAAGATSLNVETTARFEGGDDVAVTLSNGEVVRRIVDSVVSLTNMTLTVGLPGSVSSGALVVNHDAVAVADIG